MAQSPQNKVLLIDGSGVWDPSADPARIGSQNLSELINMRYAPGGGWKAVSGYSEIDSDSIPVAAEDFAANYTETDTVDDLLTVTTNKVEFSNVFSGDPVAVTRDFGAGAFSGSFEHRFSFEVVGGVDVEDSYCGICPWTLVDSDGKTNEERRYTPGGENYIAIDIVAYNWSVADPFVAVMLLHPDDVNAVGGLAMNTRYYIKIVFDNAAGDYGRYTLTIYSDPSFSTILPIPGYGPTSLCVISVDPAQSESHRYLAVVSDEGYCPSTPPPTVGLAGDVSDLTIYGFTPESGLHFRNQIADTSHLLLSGKNSANAGLVIENRTEPPAPGDFEPGVLWTDSEGGLTGVFGALPGGGAAYANGKEVCVWEGPEIAPLTVVLLADVVASASDITFTAAGDTITSASLDFWAAGFRPGMKIEVSGSTGNDNVYTVSSISGGGNVTITTVEDAITNEAAGAAVTITAQPSGNRESGLVEYQDELANSLKTPGNTMILGGGNDSYTKLLCHLDGSLGATSATDSSSSGHTLTFTGAARLTTTDKKFGTASLDLDGSTAYISIADSADWHLGAGAFTVDFWVNLDTVPAYPSYAFVFEQWASASNSFSFRISDSLMVFAIGDGTGMSQAAFAPLENLVAGRWYHMAICRDASGYVSFYLNGEESGWTNPTFMLRNNIPDMAAAFEIGRGKETYGSYYYLDGKIDEFRLSKGVERWTGEFAAPASQYVTPSMSFLAFSPRPIQGATARLAQANSETGEGVAVSCWNGNSMVALDVTDGSSGFTVDAGAITFPSTVGMARPMFFGRGYLYAYLFTLSGGNAEIYRLSLDAPFQKLGDVWDSVSRTAIAVHVVGSSDNDYTGEAAEASSAAYPVAVDVSSLATSGYLIAVFEERVCGIEFGMIAGKLNSNAARPSVGFHSAAGWVSAGWVSDGTVPYSSKTWVGLGQSGIVGWNPPEATEEIVGSFYGKTGYAYKVSFSGALSANVLIDTLTGIPAGKPPRPCDFPSAYGGRLLLCGYSAAGEGGRVDFSAPNAPDVNNGVLSSANGRSLWFGGNEPLVAGLEMFNRFGNDVHSFWLGLKKTEAYILTGSGPEEFSVRLVSGTAGCVGPFALCVAELGFEVNQGLGRNVAFWLSSSGPVVFDGATLAPLSGTERYFDQADPECVNFAALENSVVFYDYANGEVNLLIPSGSSSRPTLWLCYDVKRRAWFKKDTGGAYTPLAAIPVSDAAGVRYVYGGLATGAVVRLEDGPTWDGEPVASELATGDLMLAGAFGVSRVSRFRLFGRALTEAVSAEVSAAVDGAETYTALKSVSLAGTGRLFRKTEQVNVKGWTSRFKVAAETLTSEPGLWVQGLGLDFEYEREDS